MHYRSKPISIKTIYLPKFRTHFIGRLLLSYILLYLSLTHFQGMQFVTGWNNFDASNTKTVIIEIKA
jgi:hypothetical protein